MAPLLVLALAGGAAVVAAAVTGSKPLSSTAKNWARVSRIQRSFPPPPPFYAPTIQAAHYPLCWWSDKTTYKPVANAQAIDVRGEPWGAMQMIPDTIAGMIDMDERPGRPPRGAGERSTREWYGIDLLYNPRWRVQQFSLGQLWDVDTRTWIDVPEPPTPSPLTPKLYTWSPLGWSEGPDVGAEITDFVIHVAVPAMITFGAGLLAPGVGGVLAAAALNAAWNIAQGVKVTDAIIEQAKSALPTAIQNSAYADTYKQVVSTYNQTKSNIQTIRSTVMDVYGYGKTNRAEVAKAIDVAIGMARSVQVQQAVISAVRLRTSPDERGWMDNALEHGVTVQDWTVAMYGQDGGNLLQWAFDTANAALDAGKDPNVAIMPIMSKAVMDAIGKSLGVTTAGLPSRRRSQLGDTRRKVA